MDAQLKVLGVVPARYSSTRFPGKPLVDIDGKSMIQRVYEQAKKADGLYDVVVATDDERIEQHVKRFGGSVIMTDPAHPSGTDRCREAAEKYGSGIDVVINIQGDEPFIDPEQIMQVVDQFQDLNVQIATLVKRVDSQAVLDDPNRVKVVINNRSEALYFSRYPIPFVKYGGTEPWKRHPFWRHLGLYGYRFDVLREITHLDPSELEQAESLEQLRWLEHGYRIHVAETDHESMTVDTPEDLEALLG